MDLSKPISKVNHPARRRFDAEEDDRRASMEARMDVMEAKLDANTAMTSKIVDVFGNLEAGIKVLGMLGTFAKWAAPIVALGVTLYSLFNGKPPVDK